jgi:hypothetical protein
VHALECGKPLTGLARKYHPDCAKAVEARKHRAKAKAAKANKASTAPRRLPKRLPDSLPNQATEAQTAIIDIASRLLASGHVVELILEVDGGTIKAKAR